MVQKKQRTDEFPANREFFRYLGPHLSGASSCHAVLHPLGDLQLVPDDRLANQLDLLEKGPVVDAIIEEGLSIPVFRRTSGRQGTKQHEAEAL